jgi:hypothetical protein
MTSQVVLSQNIKSLPVETSNQTVHEVESRLNNKAIEVIQAIVGDNESRKNLFKKNIQLLASGIHYDCDYYNALLETNQNERLAFFKERNSFFHGYASPKHFKMINDNTPSGKKVYSFVLMDGVLPSEALRVMKEGLSFIGCGEVCQVAQYSAILDVLGTEKFNALFASDSSTPLIIGRPQNNPISRLRYYFMEENPSEVKKGDLVYITNAGSYPYKHYRGIARGFNAICVDNTKGSEKFTSLGLSPEGMTRDQIVDVLIAEYNKPAQPLAGLTERTKELLLKLIGRNSILMAEKLANMQITLERFKQENGGTYTLVCELDAKRIAALANGTMEQARKLLASYPIQEGTRVKV